MGEPAERSDLERMNTRTLAHLMVSAVVEDLDDPTTRMSPEAIQETVWAFAQEVVQLSAELIASRAHVAALEALIRSSK